MQEGSDFRRRRGRVDRVAAQNQDVGIGEYAEALLFGALQRAALLATGVFELAHAEEGEIVVAQPFEKGDGFRHRVLFERDRRVAELGNGLVEASQHALPVGHAGAHLAEQLLQPLAQRFRRFLALSGDMHMDDADLVGAFVALVGTAVAQDLFDVRAAMAHMDDRMGDEHRLAGGVGDLAQHRIEQERHVVVDDGHDGDGAPVADDTRVGLDVDDRRALAVLHDRLFSQLGGTLEHAGLVIGHVLCRRAGKQELEHLGRSVGGFGGFR